MTGNGLASALSNKTPKFECPIEDITQHIKASSIMKHYQHTTTTTVLKSKKWREVQAGLPLQIRRVCSRDPHTNKKKRKAFDALKPFR